ncbi:hypothetical protein BAUCODRAFT_217283 [Baudoinia panamericana UAMH 10762]|uniref:Uncharacterized protein n=1 Tax=Baudoinia panamericana (strain UAMH 10762) TaxID=717646 RepID=M2MRB8_BAUPA|nr:uncharacterized protein BAUCODRAFT_217283 [Baudoinia panamericana UAMH 10762]EMC93988.1 hypothetical protein BAUCODRAFT_217283 [Baudoinia panamericana UAMH 10762]
MLHFISPPSLVLFAPLVTCIRVSGIFFSVLTSEHRSVNWLGAQYVQDLIPSMTKISHHFGLGQAQKPPPKKLPFPCKHRVLRGKFCIGRQSVLLLQVPLRMLVILQVSIKQYDTVGQFVKLGICMQEQNFDGIERELVGMSGDSQAAPRAFTQLPKLPQFLDDFRNVVDAGKVPCAYPVDVHGVASMEFPDEERQAVIDQAQSEIFRLNLGKTLTELSMAILKTVELGHLGGACRSGSSWEHLVGYRAVSSPTCTVRVVIVSNRML